MARKNNKKASEIQGIGIYQDPKHGTILYDFLTKKGYQLVTSDIPTYTVSKAFLPAAIILFYMLHIMFKYDTLISIIVSVGAYILMRVVYRIKFLNTLPAIQNYQRPGGSSLLKNAALQYTNTQLIVILIASIALVILSILYIKVTDLDKVEQLGFIIMTIIAAALAIFAICTMIIKKKNGK